MGLEGTGKARFLTATIDATIDEKSAFLTQKSALFGSKMVLGMPTGPLLLRCPFFWNRVERLILDEKANL
jgi:hypothetical protein